MASKRDVQLVRLACKWKWLTAEQGEDCLALARNLDGKHTIEEIIRRRGYLDEQELGSLSAAADKATGRRPRLFSRASEPSPPVAAKPPPRAQTVVRALDLIPATPAAPSVRISRRPRPAGATPSAPAAPSGLPRDARRRGAAIRPAPQAPPSRDATRVETAPPSRSLGAVIPEVQDAIVEALDEAYDEPERPGAPPLIPLSREVTRFEPLPWFAKEGASVIDEPALPETAQVRVWPEEADNTRYDEPVLGPEETLSPEPVISAAPSTSWSNIQESAERTIVAPLPAELLAALRGGPRVQTPQVVEPPPQPRDPLPPLLAVEIAAAQPTDPTTVAADLPPAAVQSLPFDLSQAIAEDLETAARETLLDGGVPLAGRLVGDEGGFQPLSGVQQLSGFIAPDEETADGGHSLLDDEGQAEALLGAFGPYELERIVARGQQAVVYAGRDIASGLRVAIKVLALSPVANQAFIQERGAVMIAAASIRSPFVVKLLDVGRVDERHYVALEFVEGWSLADKLAFDETPSASDAFMWASQVALALSASAQVGVRHGDVRPDRVLIDPQQRARLGGFGFAPMSPLPDDPWAPPEGAGDTAAADAYGLGLVLRSALGGGGEHAVLPNSVPQDARDLVQALLDPDPTRRPIDFNATAEALSVYAASSAGIRPERAAVDRPGLGGLFARAGGLALVALLLTLGAGIGLGIYGLEGGDIAQTVLRTSLFAVVGLSMATVLVGTLDLIRRGELPLPQSTQWLVQFAEAAGAVGGLAGVIGLVVGPPAAMNVLLALLGAGTACSAIFGVTLRRAVARARPDGGRGRILAVLSDPWLVRWQAWHGPGLTMVTFVATARFALLAYFSAS